MTKNQLIALTFSYCRENLLNIDILVQDGYRGKWNIIITYYGRINSSMVKKISTSKLVDMELSPYQVTELFDSYVIQLLGDEL